MYKLWSFVSMAMLLLAACGERVEGPQGEDIRSALLIDLPSGIDVESVDVQVAENTGSEIEPKYRTRSNIQLTTTEAFYELVDTIDDTPVLKEVWEEGKVFDGILITNAEPVGDDSWNVDVEKIDLPNDRSNAAPASKFGDGSFVIENSDEHKALIKKSKEAEASAEREKKNSLADAKQFFTGRWESIQPLLYRDAVWSNNGGKAAISLALTSGDGDVGTGVATIYNYLNPEESVEAPISFVVQDEGITITFIESVRHRGLNFGIGSRSNWSLNKDGRLIDRRLDYDGNANWRGKLERKS